MWIFLTRLRRQTTINAGVASRLRLFTLREDIQGGCSGIRILSPSLATRGESIFGGFGWHNGSDDCSDRLRFRSASELETRRRGDCLYPDRPRSRSLEVGDEVCQHAVPARAHAHELH